MFSPIKFLGASVRSVKSSIGWNTEESRLNIELVEDYRDGDVFSPPSTGYPVSFTLDGFEFFIGLLESYSADGSSGGSPLYTVNVVDPRVLFDGYNIIVSGYSNSGSIQNMCNVYAHLESTGFGDSLINDGGIPYYKLRESLLTIVNGGTSYGHNLSYKGLNYVLDLTQLPILDDSVRISGPVLNLTDLITQVCDLGGCEYFVRMTELGTIKLYVINKNYSPSLGVITNFINTTQGAKQKQLGLTMVNDTVGRILFGGKKRDIYTVIESPETRAANDVAEDYRITWHWGFRDSDLVLGEGEYNRHFFNIDSSYLRIPGVSGPYTTGVAELRAALKDKTTWLMFLSLVNDDNRLLVEEDGDVDSVPNPFRGRADLIGGYPPINLILKDFIPDGDIDNVVYNPERYLEFTPGVRETRSDVVYDFVRSYAEEYYGRKIMVKLPNVDAKIEPESRNVITSSIPVNGGYFTDIQIPSYLNNSIFINEDGTVKPIAVYYNINTLDFSDIPDDSIVTNGNKAYIPCDVDERFYFTDRRNATGTRAVLTLPGRVKTKTNDDYVDSLLVQAIKKMGSEDRPIDIKNKLLENPITQELLAQDYPYYELPDQVYVPVESQVDNYGPWYFFTANGKMEISIEDDLVPWNYDGEDNMNTIAQARVVDGVTILQDIESGAIEFPSYPRLNLGDRLLGTGPYVTDIEVGVGDGGVTTTYRMKTWNYRFGKTNRYHIKRMERNIRRLENARNNVRIINARKYT